MSDDAMENTNWTRELDSYDLESTLNWDYELSPRVHGFRSYGRLCLIHESSPYFPSKYARLIWGILVDMVTVGM